MKNKDLNLFIINLNYLKNHIDYVVDLAGEVEGQHELVEDGVKILNDFNGKVDELYVGMRKP